MALIKCPECNHDVSSLAYACPTCGYPVREQLESAQANVVAKMYLDRVKKIEYSVPEPRAKVCSKCGMVYNYAGLIDEPRYNTPRCHCSDGDVKYDPVEIDFPLMQAAHMFGATIYYVWKYCIVPMNIGDKDSPEYKETEKWYAESLTRHQELRPGDWVTESTVYKYGPKEEYFGKAPSKTIADYNAEKTRQQSFPTPNIPKCPICNSTNIARITNSQKAGKALMWGAYSIGEMSKTYKCINCGAKF